jgi:electron transfer flavoprotein alpha subunit
MGAEVHGLVIGPNGMNVDGLGECGADKVLLAADDSLQLYQAHRYAYIAAQTAAEGSVVLIAGTAMGRDLGPRIAARMGAPYVNDVTSLEGSGEITVTRPMYSGKAIATLEISTPCVLSVPPNAFTPVEVSKAGTVEQVSVPAADGPARAETKNVKAPEKAVLDVAEASIVVAAGRGVKEEADFKVIEDLAEALGGAVGASRAVVDNGWRSHSEQVGQTGKTVSPNLYFAFGISGAIQHLAGMRSSKVIVAVNKDPEAPIFKIADYGIVGDVMEIAPRLTEEIKKLSEG